MAFPPSAVEIVENWEVLGMRGTGSHDFRVAPTFVPVSHTFSVFTDEPREPGPLYRFPFGSIAQLSFGPVALGIARHALELFEAMAAEKPVYGSGQPLASSPQVQAVMAEARVTLDSASAWFYAAADGAWDAVCAGETLDDAATETVRLASVHAAQASARAADLVFGLSRTSVIRDGDPLGRAWRDVHVVRQHAALSPIIG
jgi:alkylation response protein AidB-like acyl-CoA dehydrogenase